VLQFSRLYLEKTHYKKGLAEWFKPQKRLPSKGGALSSNPRIVKKRKEKKKKNFLTY
jgi:hypothetical protein